MASLESGRPNWLLRGLIVVSVGIHILVLAKMSGLGSSEPKKYIELEIRAEEKPAARNIPAPTPRKMTESRIETATPLSSEPAEAPRIITAPDAMLQKPGTVAPKLLKWTPGQPVEEALTPAPESMAEELSGDMSQDYYRKVLERIEENRKYPYAARKMKVEGRAVVRFVIETDGKARDVEIAESSGNRLLDKAALAAVAASSPFPPPPTEVFSKAVPLEVGVVFRLND